MEKNEAYNSLRKGGIKKKTLVLRVKRIESSDWNILLNGLFQISTLYLQISERTGGVSVKALAYKINKSHTVIHISHSYAYFKNTHENSKVF